MFIRHGQETVRTEILAIVGKNRFLTEMLVEIIGGEVLR